jgi:hypothetical protein
MLFKHCKFILLTAASCFLLPTIASAHDIPRDVTVQMFVKPDGQLLHVLVRAPLRAMRDINFPELPGGGLDIERTTAILPQASTLWISNFIHLYEGNTQLAKPTIALSRLSIFSDRSFESYDLAVANLSKPLLPSTLNLSRDEVFLDVLLDYHIQSDRSRFSIQSGLARLGLRVLTSLRFIPTGGSERAYEFLGDPGFLVLDPSWYQAAIGFVKLGFLHILAGTDHLLFLFCLVIPFRRLAALVPIVTAFTIAHSITLISSAYNLAPGFLWFPPLIETLIAVSIVYMALENILGKNALQRRWMIAFAFGLVHGFGFSFALRESLQFAGSHLLSSLLSFNVGVELGQLLVLLIMIPLLQLVVKFSISERTAVIVFSALVVHTGWHWMLSRWDILAQFNFSWPALDQLLLVELLRLLLAALILGGLLWLMNRTFHRLEGWIESFDWNRVRARVPACASFVAALFLDRTEPQSPETKF